MAARLEAIERSLGRAHAFLLDPTPANVAACAPALAQAVELLREATPEERAAAAPRVHLLSLLLDNAARFHGGLLNRLATEA
jgi:hypothetical protein